jgi:hypothetical protein
VGLLSAFCVEYPRRSSRPASLLVLTLYVGLAIVPNLGVQGHRMAADRAVFTVVLM